MPEEYLYIVDENDHVIGKAPRSKVRAKNLRHRGTNVFVFNSRGEILVTRRTDTKDVYPGLLEVGQGGAMAYGESYDDNAKREVEEEVGIKDPDLEFLFDFFWKGGKNKYIMKVYKCIYDGDIVMQKEEIADYFFISIPKLKKMIEEKPDDFTPDVRPLFEMLLESLDKKRK